MPLLEERTDKNLLQLFRTKLNIDGSLNNINRLHKLDSQHLGVKEKPTPIICRFTKYNTRQAVLEKWRNLKRSNTTIAENLKPGKVVILSKVLELFGVRQALSIRDGRSFAIRESGNEYQNERKVRSTVYTIV